MSVHGSTWALKLMNFDFDADPNPDPAIHSNADPDPVSKKHADPSCLCLHTHKTIHTYMEGLMSSSLISSLTTIKGSTLRIRYLLQYPQGEYQILLTWRV
jgi:hypothetical protein